MKNMKRIILFNFLLIVLSGALCGQAPVNKYSPEYLHNLSNSDLAQSLAVAKETTVTGGAVALVGVVAILYAKFGYENGIPDDATLFEQIMGAQGMKVIFGIAGIGMTIGGTVGFAAGLSRQAKVKKVMTEYNIPFSTLSIKPVMISANRSQNIFPGISMIIQF